TIDSGIDGFIDDKDMAKDIRVNRITPAVKRGQVVVLDFHNVRTSTQSWVHALVGEVLSQFKEPVLRQIEFKDCSPQLKALIELVVDYSLGGFLPSEDEGEKPSIKLSTAKSR
ncbi:MAG: STAS-like domain-containing protein, partial [Acidobacteriota bacterium]|nr:STAS-like domain-containing protein [Acidobacteriota bacterium]